MDGDRQTTGRRGQRRLRGRWGDQLTRSPLWLFLAILAVAVVVQLTQETLRLMVLPDMTGLAGIAAGALWLPMLLGVLLWRLVLRPLRHEHERHLNSLQRRERELAEEASRLEFDAQLHRALEFAQTEPEVLEVVRRALPQAASGVAELLLADHSDAHLRRAVASGEGEGCSVESPRDCPAVRHGRELTFGSSDDLDACPRLRDREAGPLSATCAPVAVMGRAIGVIHTARAVSLPGDGYTVARVSSLASRAGARIGMVRALADTQLQASTDALTGLANRRTFEDQCVDVLRAAGPHAFALCDLDHFKRLNDTYGHDMGDRALRLFADVLRAAIRPGDVAGRFGGEEFAVLLPHCTAEAAEIVMERVRARLGEALAGGQVPVFTVSAGVADTSSAPTLEELMPLADRALYEAKRAGRDRVRRARPVPLEPLTDDEDDLARERAVS